MKYIVYKNTKNEQIYDTDTRTITYTHYPELKVNLVKILLEGDHWEPINGTPEIPKDCTEKAIDQVIESVNCKGTPDIEKKDIEKAELELLQKIWWSRNPCHELNADSGEDMFWQCVLMVFKDFQNANLQGRLDAQKPVLPDLTDTYNLFNSLKEEHGEYTLRGNTYKAQMELLEYLRKINIITLNSIK